jgi:hypothetical protein
MDSADRHRRRRRNGRQGPSQIPTLNTRPERVAPQRSADDLHLCPACGSNLVQPVEWAPVDRLSWRVELHCPECDAGRAGIFSQPALDRFDAILDNGTIALLDDLGKLERYNMEEAIERFSVALQSDQILPEDF